MLRPLANLGLAMSIAAAAFVGCSSNKSDGTDDVPPSNSAAPPPPGACDNLGQIHPVAECDACTKSQCCGNLLDCERSADCKDLRTCLAVCRQGDQSCTDACRSKHAPGENLLSIVSTCSLHFCPIPCGGVEVTTGDAG